jgi:O-antigen/teichoic acid export membrane protein
MNALKFVAAVFVGMMLGGLAIWAVEMVGHNLYPPPADIDVSNPQNVAKAIADAPMSALLFVVLAYAVGAFIGGLVAQLIKNGPSVLSALTTGLILLIFGSITLLSVPHPTWMIVAGLAVFLPFSWLGGRLVRKKPTSIK